MHPIYVPPPCAKSIEKKEEQEKPSENEEDDEVGDSHSSSPNNTSVITTIEPLPVELENFQQIPFPDMVEQQFEDTLRELPVKLPTVSGLDEAEALVENLEKRYAAHLARLATKANGLQPSIRNAGAMETIVEDGENVQYFVLLILL